MSTERLSTDAATRSEFVHPPTAAADGRERGSAGSRAASMIGTAMLGLEQAMRREPPAEVVVREHQPARGLTGADGDFDLSSPKTHLVLTARDDRAASVRGRRWDGEWPRIRGGSVDRFERTHLARRRRRRGTDSEPDRA